VLMDVQERSVEARVRRSLQRRGYRLERCARRDPQAVGYGRYRILRGDLVVAGADTHDGYGLTPREAEEIADLYVGSGSVRTFYSRWKVTSDDADLIEAVQFPKATMGWDETYAEAIASAIAQASDLYQASPYDLYYLGQSVADQGDQAWSLTLRQSSGVWADEDPEVEVVFTFSDRDERLAMQALGRSDTVAAA
jgi:hypothetical protein